MSLFLSSCLVIYLRINLKGLVSEVFQHQSRLHYVTFFQFLLKHGNFPALCRNSRGKTELLGTVSHKPESINVHRCSGAIEIISLKDTRYPTILNSRVTVMARIMWIFDWSTRSFGPGCLRKRSTARQQSEVMRKQTARKGSRGAEGRSGRYSFSKPRAQQPDGRLVDVPDSDFDGFAPLDVLDGMNDGRLAIHTGQDMEGALGGKNDAEQNP